jgi:hypothetical protein
MTNNDKDIELLTSLGVSIAPPEVRSYTPRQARIIAGFEDIVRFRETHGRAPQHGEDRSIFERLYAIRLDRLRALDDCRELLRSCDTYGLLDTSPVAPAQSLENLDNAALLAELGITALDPQSDITQLKHVQTAEEKRAAEEIANRVPCSDFAQFKPLFDQIVRDIAAGVREAKTIDATELSIGEIRPGAYFILKGQLAYVASSSEDFTTEYGRVDRRLRVIYDNKTESDKILARSLQKALHSDDTARRITVPDLGPLFGNQAEADDLETGTIYVLRSHSTHPAIVANRELIHKIGVTGGAVETRIANAEHESTFLLAPVDIVATYTLYNIKRTRLEGLLHRVFADVQLNLTIRDRFGHPVQPREWFLVPLAVIDEVVRRIRDQSITDYHYDATVATLRRT